LDYDRLVSFIPAAKREMLSDKLVDVILASKNDEKMPSRLANTMLQYWQRDVLESESGMAVLLEAAITLEPEKAIGALNELQVRDAAELIKATLTS